MSGEKEKTVTTIPAGPGWEIAMYIRAGKIGDDEWAHSLSYEPIIAFEITREISYYVRGSGREGESFVHREVIPITVDGDKERIANLWAIKRPDGKFEIVNDCTLDDEAEALEYFRVETARAA